MTGKPAFGRILSVVLFCLVGPAVGQEERPPTIDLNRPRIVRILSTENWTDTELDVEEGQVIHFSAEGGISIQMGNPMAFCGPEGYALLTTQQPLPEENIGALIGRVVRLISVDVDKKTGEERRNEVIEVFPIGRDRIVAMPLSGRLSLGINETVVSDNSGAYEVTIRFRLYGFGGLIP